MSGDGESAPAPARKPVSAKPCPQCGKPQAEAYKPFCSKRCADIDLARWLKGSYAIPGKSEAEDGADEE